MSAGRESPAFRIALVLCLISASTLPVSTSRAAFDLEAPPPAERSCSVPDVLGLAHGSVSLVYHTSGATERAGAVGAHAFRPFGLAGVAVFALRARATSKSGRAGLTACYQSLEAPGYREQVLSFTPAISQGELWIQPGLRLGMLRAPGVYRGHCIMFDFLAYKHVKPGLRVSFGVENAFASRLHVTGGQVPRRIAAGLGYTISGKVACGLRVTKQNGLATALSTGLEWRPADCLSVGLGSCNSPRQFSFGLSARMKGLSVDVASTVHLELGMTHEAGITYVW